MKRVASRAHAVAVLAALTIASASALAARASMNLYFQSTLKDEAYQKKAFEKVSKAWKAPAKGVPKAGAKTVVQAVINAKGQLGSVGVSQSSGSKEWDDAVMSAVKRAAPFDLLPAGFHYPTVEVHVHVAVVP